MDDQEHIELAAGSVSSQEEESGGAPASMTTASRWLEILQRITEGAMAHLDLHDLLRDVLGRVRVAMRVDNTAILLLNEAGTHLTVYAAHGPEEVVIGTAHIPMGRGFAGTIAATGKSWIVDDVSKIHVENPLLRATAYSLVGTPLRAADRVIGVIHIDSATPRHFTDEDRQLLEVIASRVALAIEHAQLFEAERAARREAEAATHQLRAVQEVSDVAMEYAQLDDLLQALLRRIQEMLAVDNVAILLPVGEGDELMLYSVRGPEAAVMGKVHVPMGQGVAGTIAASRKPLIVENLDAVPVANPFLREHFRSLLGVPLVADERLVGVIHVDSVRQRTFTQEESELLQALAERIARAIDRARQYEQLRQRGAEAENRVVALEETTERMDEFLSVASHELRTPLTILNMNMQILDYWLGNGQGRRADESEADYMTRSVAAVRPLIQRSRKSITRLDRLVGDLLDASRVREDRLELALAPTDLALLVREMVGEFQEAHPTRTIQVMVDAHGPLIVEADVDRLRQVVSNYLGNALKYSRSELPVTVAVLAEDGRARVTVRDEGVGVPEEEQAAIWERFYRAARTGHQTGSQVGLGLGLYISRDIVERHGGEVGVESTPQRGSTFWFTLPLVGAQRKHPRDRRVS